MFPTGRLHHYKPILNQSKFLPQSKVQNKESSGEGAKSSYEWNLSCISQQDRDCDTLHEGMRSWFYRKVWDTRGITSGQMYILAIWKLPFKYP